MRLSTTRPLLEFKSDQKKLTGALSAVHLLGEDLWVASDELTSIERLTLRGGAAFRDHHSFQLQGIIDLPGHGKMKPGGKKELDQEIDIEGLDFEDDYLWLVGSHSIKRKKLDEDDRGKPHARNVEKLSETEREGNRFILARVPVVKNGETGEVELLGASPDGSLRAAQLPGTTVDDVLVRSLAGDGQAAAADPHLASFLSLPGKDGGFDIEGLAVAGERVFLGLRGPVLRGWAVILELRVPGGNQPTLALDKIGPQGRPYRKHFLDLGGLGVRDLCVDGADLLILAGPAMNLDGPVRLFRWQGGTAKDEETVVWGDELGVRALTIPHGVGTDHAEGMALVPGASPPSVLVVYDSPSEGRKVGAGAVHADVFGLP